MGPRLITLLAGLEMAFDLTGLIVNPLPVDTLFKTWVLTVVFVLTLAWDIGAIGVFTFVGAVASAPAGSPQPVVVITERGRRHGIYWASIAAVFTLFALLLIWIPTGIPYLATMIGIEVLLILITISDGVAASHLLRGG